MVGHIAYMIYCSYGSIASKILCLLRLPLIGGGVEWRWSYNDGGSKLELEQ
jgi:hypothetical protein